MRPSRSGGSVPFRGPGLLPPPAPGFAYSGGTHIEASASDSTPVTTFRVYVDFGAGPVLQDESADGIFDLDEGTIDNTAYLSATNAAGEGPMTDGISLYPN